ncbi:MAG TPA: flap endonuclease-1 [Halococcus sp.]|nr:flap endonuclease-1 [Halococcus sp.]
MGNADLRQLAAIESVTFSDLAGAAVAIDAHNWLYRYLTTTVKWTSDTVYTTATGEEVANLIGVVQGLPKFFENDITPIFVFDGGVTDLKTDEIERRREQKEKAERRAAEAREAGDTIEAAHLEARTQRLTGTIHETTRELLSLLDVPVVEAPAEGEAQAAHMARSGTVDYAGSEDYDTLLFGSPRTLRGLTSKGDPECMDFEATLEKHDLTWEGLVDVGILCGTDFNDGVSGVGPKTAVKLVREHGDLWGALEAEEAYIENADLIRELFLNPDVTECEFDMDIEPDIAAAREYVTEEWEIPESEVERGFSRIEESVVQSGLDRWT